MGEQQLTGQRIIKSRKYWKRPKRKKNANKLKLSLKLLFFPLKLNIWLLLDFLLIVGVLLRRVECERDVTIP
jgi:hypothetical protein